MYMQVRSPTKECHMAKSSYGPVAQSMARAAAELISQLESPLRRSSTTR